MTTLKDIGIDTNKLYHTQSDKDIPSITEMPEPIMIHNENIAIRIKGHGDKQITLYKNKPKIKSYQGILVISQEIQEPNPDYKEHQRWIRFVSDIPIGPMDMYIHGSHRTVCPTCECTGSSISFEFLKKLMNNTHEYLTLF
jgi:hypothetical protein